mgnify:FL=1
MHHPILFVSLGPGDPELLTLKALKALREADLILAPSISLPNGKENSRAANLIRAIGVNTPIQTIVLPMSRQREAAMNIYTHFYEYAYEVYQKEKRVLIAVEGDASIYASIHYVLDRFQNDGIPTLQLPGIPSFIAAASMAQLHLISQDERLMVIPGNITTNEIESFIGENYTLVIMKLSRCSEDIQTCMLHHPEYEYLYFENIGTPQSLHLTDLNLLLKRTFPYFSLLILRKKR